MPGTNNPFLFEPLPALSGPKQSAASRRTRTTASSETTTPDAAAPAATMPQSGQPSPVPAARRNTALSEFQKDRNTRSRHRNVESSCSTPSRRADSYRWFPPCRDRRSNWRGRQASAAIPEPSQPFLAQQGPMPLPARPARHPQSQHGDLIQPVTALSFPWQIRSLMFQQVRKRDASSNHCRRSIVPPFELPTLPCVSECRRIKLPIPACETPASHSSSFQSRPLTKQALRCVMPPTTECT